MIDSADPPISYSILPPPDPNIAYLITAVVKKMRACEGCGSEWGTLGREGITFDELRGLDGIRCLHLGGILNCGHEFIEAKKTLAKVKALKFFREPMKVCGKCPSPTK